MDEHSSPRNESNKKMYYDENNKNTEFTQRQYTPLSSNSKMKSPMGSQYMYGNIYDNQNNTNNNKGMVVPIQKIIPINSTFRNKIVDFIFNW
jgi:hypothetical protein